MINHPTAPKQPFPIPSLRHPNSSLTPAGCPPTLRGAGVLRATRRVGLTAVAAGAVQRVPAGAVKVQVETAGQRLGQLHVGLSVLLRANQTRVGRTKEFGEFCRREWKNLGGGGGGASFASVQFLLWRFNRLPPLLGPPRGVEEGLDPVLAMLRRNAGC